MPHKNASIENTVQQADLLLLLLPNDDGYKFLLVLVDIAPCRYKSLVYMAMMNMDR